MDFRPLSADDSVDFPPGFDLQSGIARDRLGQDFAWRLGPGIAKLSVALNEDEALGDGRTPCLGELDGLAHGDGRPDLLGREQVFDRVSAGPDQS